MTVFFPERQTYVRLGCGRGYNKWYTPSQADVQSAKEPEHLNFPCSKQGGIQVDFWSGFAPLKVQIHDKFYLKLYIAAAAWKDSQLPGLKVVLAVFSRAFLTRGVLPSHTCASVHKCRGPEEPGNGNHQIPKPGKSLWFKPAVPMSGRMHNFMIGDFMSSHLASSWDCSATTFLEAPNLEHQLKTRSAATLQIMATFAAISPWLIFPCCISYILTN